MKTIKQLVSIEKKQRKLQNEINAVMLLLRIISLEHKRINMEIVNETKQNKKTNKKKNKRCNEIISVKSCFIDSSF